MAAASILICSPSSPLRSRRGERGTDHNRAREAALAGMPLGAQHQVPMGLRHIVRTL